MHKVTKNKQGVPYFRPFGAGSEACFIILPGRIPTRLGKRKPGIFMQVGRRVYFTCPHCKGMNGTLREIDNIHRDSVMCRKCERHLFCMYRTEVPEYSSW